MGLQPILINPSLQPRLIKKTLSMKADQIDSQVVAGTADWLRVACTRATDNAERRAVEANEEVIEIDRRIGTETKEIETVEN